MQRNDIVVRRINKSLRVYYISPELNREFTDLPFMEVVLTQNDGSHMHLEGLTDTGRTFYEKLTRDHTIGVERIVAGAHFVEIYTDRPTSWAELELNIFSKAFESALDETDITFQHARTEAPSMSMAGGRR